MLQKKKKKDQEKIYEKKKKKEPKEARKGDEGEQKNWRSKLKVQSKL